MSAINTSLAALFAVTTRAFVLQPDVQVMDGPSDDDVGMDVVAIGLTAETDVTDAVENIAGLETYLEVFDLLCLVRSWTGDDDLAARRTRAFALLDVVVAAVAADPTLDGTVTRARVSNVSYHPARIPSGAVASVTFRVRIEAFTS